MDEPWTVHEEHMQLGLTRQTKGVAFLCREMVLKQPCDNKALRNPGEGTQESSVMSSALLWVGSAFQISSQTISMAIW